MTLIQNNPYRVLGVYSNASLKEITANKSKLAKYASVGKTVAFDADMAGFLPSVERTEATIEKAFADLSLPADKLKHALFWFAKDNAVDEMALAHLNAGNKDKATELLTKRNSWSTLMDLGVLALAQGDMAAAIRNISEVIHTVDYRNALVDAVCGDTFNISENDVAEMFINALLETHTPVELYPLFVANSEATADAGYLKSTMTNQPVDKLNAEISKAAAVVDDPVEIYMAGKVLTENAKPLLVELEKLLGTESMEYRLLAEKCAKQVLQCCINSVNKLQEEVEKGQVMRFKNYAPQVKRMLAAIDTSHLSANLKDRIETNFQTLKEIVQNIDEYILNHSDVCYYCSSNKSDPNAKYNKDMYLVTGRNYYGTTRQVSFKQVQVGIDRCERCKSIHERGKNFGLVLMVLMVLLGVIIGVLFDLEGGIILTGIGGFLVAYVLDAIRLQIKKKKYNIKMQDDLEDHPIIKRLMSEGWTASQPSA